MPKPGAIQRFGETIELDSLPVTSPYAQSYGDAFARGWVIAWEQTKARWGTMAGDEAVMSRDAFVERFGEDVADAYNPGVTESNAESIVFAARERQRAQQFESRGFVEFLGALGPSLPDPVNVATLPFGASNAVRANALAARGAVKEALEQSVVGGFKAGAASVPLEAAVQVRAEGQVSPEGLLLSAVAPVVFSPLLSAPGFVISKLRNGKTTRAVAERGSPTGGDDIQRAADVVAENPDLPAPPPQPDARDTGPVRLPDERFSEVGGVKQWAAAAARRDPAALDFARRNNIDMDSVALRAFFVAESNRQAVTTPPDPAGAAAASLALFEFSRGSRDPTVLETLRRHDMLREAEGLEPTLDPAFRRVSEVLASDNTGAALRQFMDDGPARTKALNQQRLWDEIKATSEDASIPAEAKRLRVQELMDELDGATSGPRQLDLRRDIDEEALLDVLDAARLEAPRTTGQALGRSGDGQNAAADTVRGEERQARLLPEDEDIRNFAERGGAEVAEVDKLLDETVEAAMRCRV